MKKRILSAFLTACMALALLPASALAAPSGTRQSIVLGNGLQEDDEIYYGWYDTEAELKDKAEVRWDVVDPESGNATGQGDTLYDGDTQVDNSKGVFLLSHYLLRPGSEYDDRSTLGNPVTVNLESLLPSELSSWYDSFLEEALTQRERDSILSVTKNDPETEFASQTFSAQENALASAKLFSLSLGEIKQYLNQDSAAKASYLALVSGNNLEVVSSSWWTRTLGENGLPMHFGKDGTLAESTAEGKHGVRPAMNLNGEDIVMISAYEDGKPVLHDVSFKVPQGSTLGILGSTGSGKSTLMYLLDRLYPVTDGTITIGGQDINDIPPATIRSNIGFVLQEGYLYTGTIADNISVAGDDISQEEVEHAAEAACVDDNIRGFAQGYETVVGERGVTLSGGQKQRVSIARTLVRKTPILVFDDSLSAVDSDTDAAIRARLAKEFGGATVILISHRITTVMHADNIIVMEGGTIAEQGTSHELLQQNGIYRQIYDMQMSLPDELKKEVGYGE